MRCRYEGSHNTSHSERVTYLGKRFSSTQFEIASFRSCVKDSKTGMRLFEGEPPLSRASFRRLTQGLRYSTSCSGTNTGDNFGKNKQQSSASSLRWYRGEEVVRSSQSHESRLLVQRGRQQCL